MNEQQRLNAYIASYCLAIGWIEFVEGGIYD